MASPKAKKVIEAAKVVFLRYGFRRATMNDIAEEAEMSRPALYLVFPNKEEVFKAAASELTDEMLEEIRRGLPAQKTAREKLNYIFEVWTVRPFEILQSSPNAQDLVECSYGFAKDVVDRGYAQVEKVVAGVLRLLRRKGSASPATAEQAAHVIVSATRGFKSAAGSVKELRAMISNLVELTVAAYGAGGRSKG
jgi:AcrR family transcriptional regulator